MRGTGKGQCARHLQANDSAARVEALHVVQQQPPGSHEEHRERVGAARGKVGAAGGEGELDGKDHGRVGRPEQSPRRAALLRKVCAPRGDLGG